MADTYTESGLKKMRIDSLLKVADEKFGLKIDPNEDKGAIIEAVLKKQEEMAENPPQLKGSGDTTLPDTDPTAEEGNVDEPELSLGQKIAIVGGAISALDPNDKAHFTKDELPSATVLTEICGFLVNKELRDQAWGVFLADNPNPIEQKPLTDDPSDPEVVKSQERQPVVIGKRTFPAERRLSIMVPRTGGNEEKMVKVSHCGDSCVIPFDKEVSVKAKFVKILTEAVETHYARNEKTGEIEEKNVRRYNVQILE